MVPPKKLQSDIGNNGNKNNMPYNKRDSAMGKAEGKGQNGARSGFRTDTAISNNRPGSERTLQPWVPDSSDGIDGSLEKSSGGGAWDQFAENERLFGLKTDYDENIYTTTIDKSHPQYRERMAAADRKAREIERSLATTAHVAEERVMDFVAGGNDQGGDEEDKYSGVRRQDFPPLGSRDNKYTPPAKRAPSSQTTVVGAPVDPAIISSQLRAPAKKQTTVKPEDAKLLNQLANKSGATQNADAPKPADPKAAAKPAPKQESAKQPEAKPAETKAAVANATKTNDAKTADKSAAAAATGRPSAATSRTISPQVKEGVPSAASTVERDVLNSFKTFAIQQRQNAEKVRSTKAKADKEVKLTELKKFADSFKLSTPVPTDLIGIIAKDPSKQKEIQAKALQNAEEVARQKADAATKSKDTPSKEASKPVDTPAAQSVSAETRSTSRPTPTQSTISPSNAQNRHPNARQSYASPQYQTYRNDRPGMAQNRQPLAQRLRNVEQQKLSQPPAHQQAGGQDMRLPPTGPANNNDAGFPRRISGVPSHMGGKLNPNSHEFRPSPFAASFNPNGHPSAGSSPRSSAANNVAAPEAATAANPSPVGQLIRRKTKAVDVKKCYILAHVKTFQPIPGRNWDENEGLRPSYDTPPTWRSASDNEKEDSTMLLTSKEFLERQSFASSSMATPNNTHVVPNAHQHQLPFHLQQPAHGMGPRQSPHMPPMPMQNQHGGHGPHGPYPTMDDHRMMHSNSAQSFASPRMAQVPITYTPAMGSAGQVPYNQPMMQPFVGPGTPNMGGFRNFSSNHQYMPQQPGGPMGGHMMPQFINPQGMVPAPQMPMYAGGHAQFMPPNAAPPQGMPGSNGYPSPGRPVAPMMAHQGSQQGQPVYGMSPNVQYQQPAFTPQQPGGQVGRGYNNHGPQHFGTSPSQMHSYGAQHRSGSNNYGAKSYNSHGQHQGPQQGPAVQAGGPGRGPDGAEEAK
ncbi:pab1 binding protein [Colletotrichum karsti]|uniref:Pab1 binding protein n=1 Tax=Colletotrichum karsti TaxID=1095194 RepID=A0A9P6IA18_9PEZI|nr:pab1 binding protein [Colletotrichum karsti]KAF9878527.1 pab1 binding protein [Colletotrichum karsti]